MTLLTQHPESHTAVADAIAPLSPVNLEDVLAVAGLQERTDTKYLLTPDQFGTMVDRLGDRFSVLQINDRRVFAYESVYFDTPDLALFRAHRQGRRLRYKVRTRTYVDSQETMFEVKLEGRRGETIKRRLPYPLHARDRLTDEGSQFFAQVLRNEYGMVAPELQRALVTSYDRATLVDLQDGARLTCDVGLVCSTDDVERPGPDRIIVESKSAGGRAVADRVLASMGVRMISVSKYAVGTAMVHPHLPANRWSRLLRQEFGWEPERAA